MRILVIEDEHKIAGAIKRGLELETYAVDVAYDADSGLASALSEEYDVMIIDRMLPGSIDGLKIVTELRKQGNHVPVLLLTAKGQVKDKVEGLNAGADDYLVKPFAFEELLARVKALLRRPAETLNDVIDCQDVKLDTVKYEVSRSNKPVSLTSKEFALLEYLMRNKGQTLSKDRIISHVWDYDADILPNSVEVYIGYLRNKLEKPFGNRPFIKTVRGFGYKLEP